MPDFNVRSDSVNVEQVMEQIRARIREKRGVDYTEEEIRALATVKLEKFLDPRGVRSDLLEQFRRAQPAEAPAALPNYAFEEETLFESHRAPIRWIRALLRPLLKLFFNPGPLVQALHIQSQLNTMYAERDARRDAARRGGEQLQYEVLHNLVIEMTRTGIEVKNLKMQIESLAGRLEFSERRARTLESLVVYTPDAAPDVVAAPPAKASVTFEAPAPSAVAPPAVLPAAAEGPGQRSRRRRRRRGRRSGAPAAVLMGGQAQASPSDASAPADVSDGPDEGADAHSPEADARSPEEASAPSEHAAPEAGPSEERARSSDEAPHPAEDPAGRSGQAGDQ